MLHTQNPDPDKQHQLAILRPVRALWHWMFPPTQAHRDRQSTTARVVAATAIICFSAALVFFVLTNGRSWHRAYKAWQSDRSVTKSERFEKEEKLMEAVLEANKAYLLAPENPKAIRLIARYYTLMKRNEAAYFFKKLRDMNAMTDDDIIMEIQSLSNVSEDKLANDKIEEVLTNSKPTQKIVQTADLVMQKLNRKEQLIAILKKYVSEQPDDQEIKLLLAMRQLELGDQTEAEEGRKALWELAHNPDKVGLKAIEYLNRQKVTDKKQQMDLIELLQKHPLVGEEHRIAALRRLSELNPGSKQEIIENAMKDRANMKREDLVPLVRWLSMEGESEKVISFLKEDMVLDYLPLLQNYLNALTMLKRYDDMERIVNDPRARLTTAERGFHRVHLAFVTNKDWDTVNSLLVDALAAAQGEAKPDMVLAIAKYAEERNHLLAAEQAYRAASTIRRTEREGFEGLLRLTYLNGNSKSFLETAKETARRWPDKELFLERYLYACLLSGLDMEIAINRAQIMLTERPTDNQRKLIMALAHSRQLDPQSAARYLQQINLSDLSLGQGAVLCGIMQSAGYTNQAAKIASQIPDKARMLPEEERFLLMVRKQNRS